MSTIDQCPSTKNTIDIPEELPPMGTVSGRKYWRSIEEYSSTPEFKELLEREFPVDASIMDDTSRRSFLKVMGASMALAGAATIPGCRRPDRKILPYAREAPEEIIPGRPLFFATGLALPGGGAEGLLVESHTGRPTKIEGNPLHPNNQGKSSAFAQASLLDLYDPDRLKYPIYKNPTRGRLDATWDDFDLWANEHFAKFDRTRGKGLAFIIDEKSSAVRDIARIRINQRWPEAEFVSWDPAQSVGHIGGSRHLFGAPHWARYNLAQAKRIVAVGEGQLDQGPEALRLTRELTATRKVRTYEDEMSRLYAIESKPSGIGVMADHRFRVSPTQQNNFVVALAKAVMSKTAGLAGALPDTEVQGISASEIQAIADDLFEHRGHAVVIPSDDLSAEAWALCQSINETLQAKDNGIVEFFPMVQSNPAPSSRMMQRLTGMMKSGAIDTLVCLDTNPLYDAPGSVDFADAFSKVNHTITLSVGNSETAAASTWSLNGTHFLEAWDIVYGIDGQLSITQPLIAPLYDPARSQIEFIQGILNAGNENATAPEGYSIVKDTLRNFMGLGESEIDKVWKASLHNGVVAGTIRPASTASLNTERPINLIRDNGVAKAPGQNHLDVQFYTDRYNIGQLANNPWLQELPEFGTSVVWDNPLLLSPRTAKALGVLPEHTHLDEYDPYTKQQMPQAQLVDITLDGRTVTMPAWILPGMADNTVAIKLGYGRTNSGRVGNDVGFNSYDIKVLTGMITSGAKIKKASGTYTIASTQNHWSMEGRDTIVRAMDKKWFDKYAKKGNKEIPDKIYGKFNDEAVSSLNVAEQLGELSHTPANISAYVNPQNESRTDAAPGSQFSKNPQWGMSIDMNACTGCNTCTVACQSENNIPVVGKSEVAKGREMAWIRIDRYFTGDDLNNPDEIFNQPIACVHCENAPCETVCPVNATTHGPEGTNDIAYNRCIGTRYCANNCPYKVRRFNFFDYAPTKFNGGLDPNYTTVGASEKFEETVGQDRTFNQNLIPPRLRKKLDEISKMKFNPDVTVRSRGVIEKCTYCIQRVNQARQDVKVQGIWTEKDQIAPVPDGFFQVACQQACPADAIAFGDILDPNSRVTSERDSHRTYALLGYLNTRPRTTHMMRVRNPNPAIRVYDLHDPLDHSGGHHDGHKAGSHGMDSHDEVHPNETHEEHESHESHSSVFTDSVKQYLDQGYSLSLKVIS
ncbi:MAG: TAT-variant-translocated molybdopterin oxidoreductase [Phycisphaerales bacterium]|nr:TAT-variant-translocated molybdopterin oxidoreductase [Phycisphaerales bacterium]